MDELEAVNMLLRLIGSSPVNSLETAHPDAKNAKVTLDRVRKQTQRKSWWFNSDYNLVLEADTKGFVAVPKQYTSVTFKEPYYIERSGRVYDKVNQTSKIGKDVETYLCIQILDWDNLPDVVQDYCAYSAAVQFIRDELEDPSKSKELKEDAAKAFVDMKNQDLTENKYNMFNKARVRRARVGVRPYGMTNRVLFTE